MHGGEADLAFFPTSGCTTNVSQDSSVNGAAIGGREKREQPRLLAVEAYRNADSVAKSGRQNDASAENQALGLKYQRPFKEDRRLAVPPCLGQFFDEHPNPRAALRLVLIQALQQ